MVHEHPLELARIEGVSVEEIAGCHSNEAVTAHPQDKD
jgi:hypothetical protein